MNPPRRADTKPDDIGNWIYPVIVLTPVILFQVTWPLRNIVLIIWVYGMPGYRQGIRVNKGKPTKFNDSAWPSDSADLITGFGAFVIAACISMSIVLLIRRLYERAFRKP